MKSKLILIILLQSIQLHSQELFFNFDVGYGLKIATESITEGNLININESEWEHINVIYSFGQGININSDLTYFLNKHVGFGLGAGYLKSAKVKLYQERFDQTSDQFYSANMLRLFPFITFKFTDDKLTYYFKVGYLMGLSGEIKRESNSIDYSGNQSNSMTIFNKGISHGAIAGFGINYKLSNRVNIYSELRFYIQSYGPKKRELVKYEYNGEDKLPEIEPGLIHTNYVDNFIKAWDPSGGTDLSEPMTRLRIFYPFSSIGLNIGIQYKLNSKK